MLYTSVTEIAGGPCNAESISHTAPICHTPSNGAQVSASIALGTNTHNLLLQRYGLQKSPRRAKGYSVMYVDAPDQ